MEMDGTTFHRSVAWLINFVAGTIFGALGWVIASASLSQGASPMTIISHYLGFTLCGLAIWATIYIAWGLRIVRENNFLIIERFGSYYRTKSVRRKKADSGLTILCLPGLVDQTPDPVADWDYLYHRLDIYAGATGQEIDFKDGSAAVKIQVWYKVNDEPEDASQVHGSAYRFVYTVDYPKARIREIIESAVRLILQRYTVDEAQNTLIKIAKEIRENEMVANSLANMEVVLEPNEGVVITDIVLPEEIKQFRRQAIQGRKDAERTVARGQGYIDTILAIQKAASLISQETGGRQISFEEARHIFETQRGLEVIEQTGANVTFVSPNLGEVVKTLNLNEKKET